MIKDERTNLFYRNWYGLNIWSSFERRHPESIVTCTKQAVSKTNHMIYMWGSESTDSSNSVVIELNSFVWERESPKIHQIKLTSACSGNTKRNLPRLRRPLARSPFLGHAYICFMEIKCIKQSWKQNTVFKMSHAYLVPCCFWEGGFLVKNEILHNNICNKYIVSDAFIAATVCISSNLCSMLCHEMKFVLQFFYRGTTEENGRISFLSSRLASRCESYVPLLHGAEHVFFIGADFFKAFQLIK